MNAIDVAESMLGHPPEQTEVFQPSVGGDDSLSFRLWDKGEAMLLKVKRRSGSPRSKRGKPQHSTHRH